MSETAFFITPLGDTGSPTRQRADDVLALIEPVLEELGLTVVRADKQGDLGRITSHAIRAIQDARVVVADLTGFNPNVMYELGLADLYEKPVVVITDNTSTLPFDRAADRAIKLDSMHFRETEEFRQQLREMTRAAIERAKAGGRVDNPVTAADASRALSIRAESDPLASALERLQESVDEIAAQLRSQAEGSDRTALAAAGLGSSPPSSHSVTLGGSTGHALSATPGGSTGHTHSATPGGSTGHTHSATPGGSTGHTHSATPGGSTAHTHSATPGGSTGGEVTTTTRKPRSASVKGSASKESAEKKKKKKKTKQRPRAEPPKA